MQTTTSLKRLFAAVMAVVMMLTAIPFVTAADETAVAKDTLVFGGLSWDIVTKEDDGDLVIITTDVLAKAAYNAKAPMNFATSSLYTTLNTDFYATFSDAEKAAITPTTITYDYWDATAGAKVTGATLSANVVVPDVAMAASLGVANLNGSATQYFLASARANSKTDAVVSVVTKAGSVSSASGTSKTASGYRAVITLKSGNYAQFPAVDGVSYTVNDNAVTYYATTSATSFKVVVDTDNYTADELAVALGGETLTATDGIYTIAAGTTAEITVSGVEVQPADFTAYNEAVAKAEEVDSDLCDTTDLDAALAVDVSACTKLEQAKVDEATAAILDAIANLKYKPADTAKLTEAIAKLEEIKANKKVQVSESTNTEIYNLDAIEPVSGKGYYVAISNLIKEYSDYVSYTIDKQAEVDEAVAAMQAIIDNPPYKTADNGKWLDALTICDTVDATVFKNAAEIKEAANKIKEENDFTDVSNIPIIEQQKIDDATKALNDLYATRVKFPADYTALDAILETAATQLRENYYFEDEMAGSDAAWAAFEKAYNSALSLDREAYSTISDQKTIDDHVAVITRTMEALAPFIRLTPWQEFWKPVKEFFQEIADFFGMVGGLLKTIFDLIPLLISGEIVLYDVFVLIGDEDLLALAEKLGIKPAPEEPAPEA